MAEKKEYKNYLSTPTFEREFNIIGVRVYDNKQTKKRSYAGEFLEKDRFGNSFVALIYSDKPMKEGKQKLKVSASVTSFRLA
jgi:hypothetical protein